MCALLATKRYELLYNSGIQLLHIGRPLAAFECLMEAVQVYHSNPRLWLRLAECCISANKGVWLNLDCCSFSFLFYFKDYQSFVGTILCKKQLYDKFTDLS